MSQDVNGELLGIEFIETGKRMRLRLIYPGGAISHVVPERLATHIRSGGRKFGQFAAGKSRHAKFGIWAGPE